MSVVSGTITKGIAGFYYVHDGYNSLYECKAKGVFRNRGEKPLPGDRVQIEITDDNKKLGNIISIAERKNTLIRPAAANIDQALLTFAIRNPDPSFNLIDRLLVYYKMMNIPAILAFGKSDLDEGDLISEYSDIYKNSGIDIIFFSSLEYEGLDKVREVISGKTTVITGPSGVGKSSLINTLVPKAEMEVGEISSKLKRGKNTTRHTELFSVFDNTYILDTPGFTSFVLEGINEFELKDYYDDFAPYRGLCRFDDCVHIGETSCKVKDAVTRGEINKVRYENYRMIYSELKSARKY